MKPRGSFETRRPVAPATGFPCWCRDGLVALGLLAVVLVVYSPALHGGFLWDDDSYISDNATLRSWKGLWEIWFNPKATCQYYPLSFTGFWAGYHLWGYNTPGYHGANVFFHTAAAVLLWQVFKRLQLRGALLAGALFALHPVNVMSVAWMTEFKNTLSGALALGAAWAYLRFEGLGVYAVEPGQKRPWRWYALLLVLFQLAMFAKTAVSFLPVSLLLIAWWRRGRTGWREIAPVLPLVAIVAAMGGFTMFIERTAGGAHGADFALGFPEKVLVSGRSFWFYLGKLLFPVNLVFFYPRWHLDAGDWRQYLWPAATAALLAGLWVARRRIGRGAFAAAMHFYVSTSLLVLMVVLFMMRYSFVSDHWQYFGTMGVMPAFASAIMRLRDRPVWGRPARNIVAAGVLCALALLSRRQCAMYADSDTLYKATLERNPGSWLAHCNLGYSLLEAGKPGPAIGQFKMALEIKPDLPDAHIDLGNALEAEGRVDAAIEEYEAARRLAPGMSNAYYNLGIALQQKGKPEEAFAYFTKAVEIEPESANAQNNLGLALLQRGNAAGAIGHFQKALEIEPGYAQAHSNLGLALLQTGRTDAAVAQFQKALEIKPGYPEAHYNLGIAFQQYGRTREAATQYQMTLDVAPGHPGALNNLAYLLAACPDATLRDGARAVELARQASDASGGRNPVVLGTLAAAYAETKQFPKAVETAENALEFAVSDPRLADTLRAQIALYKSGTPLRDASLAEPHLENR